MINYLIFINLRKLIEVGPTLMGDFAYDLICMDVYARTEETVWAIDQELPGLSKPDEYSVLMDKYGGSE